MARFPFFHAGGPAGVGGAAGIAMPAASRPHPPPGQGQPIFAEKDDDIATFLQMRAMLAMARDDPGMHDLLSRAKEYYALKGSPTLNEVLNPLLNQKHDRL